MKADWLKPFSGEIAWWNSLAGKEKWYVGYFLLSFTLLVGMADCNPIWMMFLAVLNFGNSVRLIKRVPIDKLEDY
jgi:hypothetical protein|nr:MAG TPA: hypothetical protein [Caudoviricetes sp.]